MNLSAGVGLKTSTWFPNQSLRNDDINYIGKATYQNFVDEWSVRFNRDWASSGNAVVIGGLNIVHDNLLTVTLQVGSAISSEGTYFGSDSWGYSPAVDSFYAVIVSQDTQLGFVPGGAFDRYDILEIRPVENSYGAVTRNFKDPVTGIISTAVVDSRIEYGWEFAVRKGDDTVASSLPPNKTSGWIKIAEVFVPAGATAIDDSNITTFARSMRWRNEIGITGLSPIEVGIISSPENEGVIRTRNAHLFRYINTPSILIPAYVYPTFDGVTGILNGEMGKVLDAARGANGAGIYAILNPASGPGAVVDGSYVSAMRQLKAAGVITLGYVATGFQYNNDVNTVPKSIAAITGEVDTWASLYNREETLIDGIFYDEMGYLPDGATYQPDFMQFNRTIKKFANRRGFAPIVSNPGVAVPNWYFEEDHLADVIVIYENTAYPTEDNLRLFAYNREIPNSRRGVLVYGAGVSFDDVELLMMKKYASMLYINDGNANWDGISPNLPTTSQILSSSSDVVNLARTQTIAGDKNFTGALQKDGSDVVNLASTQTIAGDKNFTGAFSLNGYPVTTKFGAETFQKILATDPQAGDYFGWSVSISGDYAIVGAYGEDAGGSDAGAAYIYRRTGLNLNTWGEGFKILATDPQSSDFFGRSVAISGDYAIVGAYGEDAGGADAGAAYIYRRTGLNTWGEGIKIVATDPQAGYQFGLSVAISGDYAIVGARFASEGAVSVGAAYIYRRTGLNTWGEGIKILATDPQVNDQFGIAVAISGDYAIVGAQGEDEGGSNAGAAYIYRRTGLNTWGEGFKILATDPQSSDQFGAAVAISGDYAIVGAFFEDAGGSDAGAAYIYRRTGLNTWGEGIKIVATDPQAGDHFGYLVAISGDYAIVGARYEDEGGSNAGAAYIYRRTGLNTWGEGFKILATDPEVNDQFGISVAISGDYAIVGAYREGAGGADAGAAYGVSVETKLVLGT